MSRRECPEWERPCRVCDAEAERRKDDRNQPDDSPNGQDENWPIGMDY